MVNTPLTRSALPLASLLDALSPPQILCGGRVDPVSAAMADARGLILRDYFAREELAVANAVPTALPVGHYSARREHTAPPLAMPGAGLNC